MADYGVSDGSLVVLTSAQPGGSPECCIRYCTDQLVTMPCGAVICEEDLACWAEQNMNPDGSVHCCLHYSQDCIWPFKALMEAFKSSVKWRAAIISRQGRLGCLSNPRMYECPTPGCRNICTADLGANLTICKKCHKVSQFTLSLLC